MSDKVDILQKKEKTTKGTQKRMFQEAAKALNLRCEEFVTLRSRTLEGIRERTVLRITDGRKTLLTLGATTSQTSYLGMKVAVDKSGMNDMLRSLSIPTTEQIFIRNISDVEKSIDDFGRIIMKPAKASSGKGIHSNIRSVTKAREVYEMLRETYDEIVVERIIEGAEYRILVINGRVFAVAEYISPTVTGDGISTIGGLIRHRNANVRREHPGRYPIRINDSLKRNLGDMELGLDSVLSKGECVVLHKAAPISNGGYAVDATDRICPENRAICERIADWVGIDIIGIDIITPDISRPIGESHGAVIEANGGPELDIHMRVEQGIRRDGAYKVLTDFFGIRHPEK